MFDEPVKLLLGLITGFVFGFLLQKGRVAKFEVIIGQFLLRDWTVAKIMLTAIAVGAVGVYAMVGLGWASLHVRPLQVGGIVAGALLFGIGMGVLGYCPGTTVAACGEGRRDAMAGLAGMLLGAAVYVAAYPALHSFVQVGGDFGKITVPQISHTSAWAWIIAIAVIAVAIRVAVGRKHEESHPGGLPFRHAGDVEARS